MATPYEDGNPASKVCYLAEAPSHMEIINGKPLVGPSGFLFNELLHAAGLIRREGYILNVWPFQVRKLKNGDIVNKAGDLLWTHKGHFTELGEHEAAGTRRRLAECGADVIVPMGGTALSFLYPDSRIMKWRGSPLSTADGVRMIPTIHPAASLHGNYVWRDFIGADLDKVRRFKDDPTLGPPDRDLIIEPTFQQVMEFFRMLGGAQEVASDIEVLNHQISCFSLCAHPMTSLCIPLVGDAGRDYFSRQEEADIWLAYEALLMNPEITITNQNIIFDLSVLVRQNGIRHRGPLGDPMIAHHIIWPDYPKGLDFLCSVHTDEPYYKDDGKLWKKPWADLHTFWRYNGKDAATALEILWAIQSDLDNGFRGTYEDTMHLLPTLLYMMTRGVKVDMDRLAQTRKDVAAAIDEKEADLEHTAERPFNPASPKQCQEYFYVTKGIKPYISRKTGNPTTDDTAMARIFRKHNLREAKLVQEIRALRKLSSTYLEVGIDRDNRVRSSYNPRGTVTGRLSSSQTIFGTGMNMQNLHPDFKGFLVADHE